MWPRVQKAAAILIAGGFAVALVLYIAYLIFAPWGDGRIIVVRPGDNEGTAGSAASLSDPAGITPIHIETANLPWHRHDPSRPAPVFIPRAGLRGWEPIQYTHVPPRDPSQMVPPLDDAEGYTVPPDPLAVAKSLPKLDPGLMRWLQAWGEQMASGSEATPPAAVRLLGETLSRTSLSSVPLYEIGRGTAYIEGEQAAVPWYEAALERAQGELNGAPPDAAAALMHALRRMGLPLWLAGRFASCETLYGLLAAREVGGSADARRAAFLHAETLLMQGDGDAAAERLLEVAAHNDRIGAMSEADRATTVWAKGLVLFEAGRYTEALPHLRVAAKHVDQPYVAHASEYLVICFAEVGRIGDAERQYDEWCKKYAPSFGEAVEISTLIAKAKASQK